MEKHRRLPILQVVQTQNSEFERYWIEDQDNRVCLGGSLFATLNDAAIAAHGILKRHFVGTQPERYVVPLTVEVFSHEPVLQTEIASYLSRSSRLQIDSHDYGNGPGDSLVLPWIEWHRIKAAKELPHE